MVSLGPSVEESYFSMLERLTKCSLQGMSIEELWKMCASCCSWFGFDGEGAGMPLMLASPSKVFSSEGRVREGQAAETLCCCPHEESGVQGAK